MRDSDCAELLRWLLPRRGLRPEGWRRVRGQACKRLHRRIAALGLDGPAAYRQFLEEHPDELAIADELCRISISRFYRDRAVFDALRDRLLPELATAGAVRAWSAGCAGGEEPYTLALIWRLAVGPRFPAVPFQIVASDADPVALERARRGCYRSSSLKELPAAWRERAFLRNGELFCLSDDVRASIDFRCEDLRDRAPEGPFQLILCRNLGFTYFGAKLQEQLLARLLARLAPGGLLVIGSHEQLPAAHPMLAPDVGVPGVFSRATR